MGWLLRKLATSVLSRWILGGVVALLLGGSYAWWHSHKEGLREEGIQECVQEINQATIDELELALADSESANADLRASLIAAAAVNQEAVARRNESESRLASLRGMIEQQRKNDETYREWADADLPGGVADRLREAARSTPNNTD